MEKQLCNALVFLIVDAFERNIISMDELAEYKQSKHHSNVALQEHQRQIGFLKSRIPKQYTSHILDSLVINLQSCCNVELTNEDAETLLFM